MRRLRWFVGCGAWMAATVMLFLVACSGGGGSGNDQEKHPLPVTFENASIFVGSYQEIGVQIEPDAGIVFDDLDFQIDPAHGKISPSRGTDFDPAQPTILLIAGTKPGAHAVRAIDRATGRVLGKGQFEVYGGLWPIDREGPPIVFESRADFDWAPAPEGPAPGRLGIYEGPPMIGTRKVLVIHLDTSSRRLPTDFDPNVWGQIFDSSKGPSVRRYIEEVSGRKLQLEVQVASHVIRLPMGFEAYFRGSERAGWFARPGIFQAIASLSQGAIDLPWADELVLVALDPDPWTADEEGTMAPGGRWVHPHYAGKPAYSIGGENRNISTLFMAEERKHRDPVDLGVHVFGHALGLPDLHVGGDGVTPPDDQRIVSDFDPMAGIRGGLPHFSMVNKIRLGWVAEDELAIFDLTQGGREGVRIMRTSQATEKPEHRPLFTHPAAGYLLAPGLAYLWENRATPDEHLPGGIADRHLPVEPVILGTEYNRHGQPPLLTLRDDQGDGARLTEPGQKYLELDGVQLGSRGPIEARLAFFEQNVAYLLLDYGDSLRPELSIFPWEVMGPSAYRSRDVTVRNARNWDGQAWTDLSARWDALIDAENRIVAGVHNIGSIDAPGVKVVFRYAEWAAGQEDLDWVKVSTTTVDIPAGRSVWVESDPWIPRSQDGVTEQSQYRIQAVITGDEDDLDAPYAIPGTEPPVHEIRTSNNRASSNVTLVPTSAGTLALSFSASLPTRVEQMFRVHNPSDEERVFRLEVLPSNPLSRAYVGHRWVTIPPQGQRDVPVFAEYSEDGADPGLIDAWRDRTNTVIVRAATHHGEDDFRAVGGTILVVPEGDRSGAVDEPPAP